MRLHKNKVLDSESVNREMKDAPLRFNVNRHTLKVKHGGKAGGADKNIIRCKIIERTNPHVVPTAKDLLMLLITYCSFNISEVWLIPLYRYKLWHPCPAVSRFWFADAIVVLFAVLCYHRFQ